MIRWFQDKDVKHIWARIIQEKENGWVLVAFNHNTFTPRLYNYHIDYLKMFYNEELSEAGHGEGQSA